MKMKVDYFSSSPGLIAMTFPSTTDIAPRVPAAMKSQVIWKENSETIFSLD